MNGSRAGGSAAGGATTGAGGSYRSDARRQAGSRGKSLGSCWAAGLPAHPLKPIARFRHPSTQRPGPPRPPTSVCSEPWRESLLRTRLPIVPKPIPRLFRRPQERLRRTSSATQALDRPRGPQAVPTVSRTRRPPVRLPRAARRERSRRRAQASRVRTVPFAQPSRVAASEVVRPAT